MIVIWDLINLGQFDQINKAITITQIILMYLND